MSSHPLFCPVPDQVDEGLAHDRIQVALAIADSTVLQSLLTHSLPPVTRPHLIGSVSARVTVPVRQSQPADAVLSYEAVQCVLSKDEGDRPPASPASGPGGTTSRGKGPRWESASQTLPQRFTLAQAIAMLTNLGFSPRQVEEILYLPAEAGHKSWWYSVDGEGNLTLPFLRLLRTLRYSDGTFAFQYKDFFDQEQPPCFKNQQQQVLVEIKSDLESFSETLHRINVHREALEIQRVVLVCNLISELEARGFMGQGISLYPAIDLVLPTRSDCMLCARQECPMNGIEQSPVAMCYGFVVEGTRI
ncbi:MAG: hypothetical protein SFW36_12175 [Leptolyngbyaceae cyanobacterium bins.59]|nr:hypothetical protein [Leptolyngbyaceae cyanobacterium bins.59]